MEKTTFSELKNCVRSPLEPFLYKKTHRNPIVIPVNINSKQTMEQLQKKRKMRHAKPNETKEKEDWEIFFFCGRICLEVKKCQSSKFV